MAKQGQLSWYEGIVEDNQDPSKIGRCKIRIPELHGVDGSDFTLDTDVLPWFQPNVHSYAGYNAGNLNIPPLGSVVNVLIQESDDTEPKYMYIGGSYGIGASEGKLFGKITTPAKELETMKDNQNHYTESGVIFRSPNGATVFWDDVDKILKLYYGGSFVCLWDIGDITISGKRNILIEGKTITMNAQEFIHSNSGKETTINASTNATVSATNNSVFTGGDSAYVESPTIAGMRHMGGNSFVGVDAGKANMIGNRIELN
jgi:hypothetical protein